MHDFNFLLSNVQVVSTQWIIAPVTSGERKLSVNNGKHRMSLLRSRCAVGGKPHPYLGKVFFRPQYPPLSLNLYCITLEKGDSFPFVWKSLQHTLGSHPERCWRLHARVAWSAWIQAHLPFVIWRIRSYLLACSEQFKELPDGNDVQ